ncbi:MAG: multidrug ABC transporter ATPase [Promethearchaeota archaeon CR_4]|nr:MAG: multidrug ABC transporter ATPase [Candidatus Lokiarchaeota archaeon CR_4]
MTGLDPASRYQVKQILKQLAKDGITILFSSHILSDVQDIASRIGILGRGKIMNVGTPTELQERFRIGDEVEIVLATDSKPIEHLERVVSLETVTQQTPERMIIRLSGNANVDESLSQILRELITQGCHLRNFNLLKPSLEEIYLKYVGGAST